jgi:hypothetical protein
VYALRNIHTALVPNGLLVDTQPVSAHPRVARNGTHFGLLDMREWLDTICAVEQRVTDSIAAGLFELSEELELVVTSRFDDGRDCLEIAGGWQGTSVPRRLARRLATTHEQVAVEQQVRLRVLRRASGRDSGVFPAGG